MPAIAHALAADLLIRPFDAPCGAEVIGLDLSRPLADADFARIHRAHLDHHVLVFRDMAITPAQQVDFSRRFGPLQRHVLGNFALAGHPEVLVISNIKVDGKPIGLGDAGAYWHSDLSYLPVPSLGSMLHAKGRSRPAVYGRLLSHAANVIVTLAIQSRHFRLTDRPAETAVAPDSEVTRRSSGTCSQPVRLLSTRHPVLAKESLHRTLNILLQSS